MTSFEIPFDPIGFSPKTNGSTILNILNTIEYNIILQYKIVEDQIDNYNFITDKNKQIIHNLYQLFIKYILNCDFEKALKGLDGYEYGDGKIPPLEEFIDMYVDRNIPIEHIQQCMVFFSQVYEKFKKLILEPKINEEEILQTILNNFDYSNSSDPEYFLELLKCFYSWLITLRKFVLDYWQMEVKDIVINKYLEAATLNEYIYTRITDEGVVDLRIENLQQFIDYVVDHVIQGRTRSSYFQENRYSPKIIEAQVGGKSILEWYTDVIVYYKRVPKTIEVINDIRDQWINYIRNNGYYFHTDEFLYFIFQKTVKHLLPEVVGIIETEQEQENLLAQLQLLKEKLKSKELEQEALLNEINQETEKLDDEGKQKYKKYLDENTQNQPLTNLNMMIALYSTLKDKYSTADYYLNYYKDQVNAYLLKVNKLEANIVELQQMIDKKNTEINEIKTANETLENNIIKKQEENEKLENDNKTIKQQIIDLSIQGKNLQDKYNILENEKTKLINTNIKLQNKNKELEKSNKNLNDEKSNLIAELNKVKDDIEIKNKNISQLKNEINKLKNKINELNDTYTTNINNSNTQINSIQTKINQLAKEKQELNNSWQTKIKYSNEQINNKQNEILQLEKEKEELNQKEIKLNEKIKTLNQQIEENNKIIAENQKIIEENNIRVQEIEDEKIKLKQEREEIEKLKNDNINILEMNNKTIENNKLIIMEMEEKHKQNEFELEKLNEIHNKLNDSLDKRLEEILCIIPVEFDMEIRRFRFLFFNKIKEMYPGIPFEISAEDSNSNDYILGSKKVSKWYEYYIEKIKTLIDDDFNPEGILSKSPFRMNEEKAIRNLIINLKKNNEFLDFINFKLKLFDLTEEEQKNYFLERINNVKIGTAIFGTKTIDEWYNALVSQFFNHEE